MKYSRMLCWVNQEIKTELINFSNGQINIIFVDNYKDFKNNISDDVYPTIALSIANKNIKRLQSLLQIFSNYRFRIIVDIDQFCGDVIETFTEADRRFRSFTAKELIENFKKVESQ